MRAVFRFGGFPIAAFGSHRFVVSWLNPSGVKTGEALLDFDVVQVTQVAQGIAWPKKALDCGSLSSLHKGSASSLQLKHHSRVRNRPEVALALGAVGLK